jgi:alpha-galactosidase
MTTGTTLHRLRSAGVDLLLHVPTTGLPEVLHWGADLGDLDPADPAQVAALRAALGRPVSSSALDAPWPLTILPGETDGWQGRPGLAGERDGRLLLPRWGATAVHARPGALDVTAEADGLRLRTRFALDAAGVLRVSHEVTSTAAGPVAVTALEVAVPIGDAAGEVLDFTGRWTRERVPQRRPLAQGSQVRETRRGRTGHDSPMLLVAGTPGFDASHGETWAVHLAWSADAVYRLDALPEAPTVIGAGALLRPGEVVLAPGESLRTPDVVLVWSDAGLDGIGDRLHASLRARPSHPRTPRPVTLNTWEAVYFSHDLDRLTALARTAAVPTAPASATGRSTPRCGPRAWPRSATWCTASACSSACGSSRRWSTSTPTWPARTPTGCCTPPTPPGAPGGTSTCSTSPAPRSPRTCWTGSPPSPPRPASTTSSGTRTATCSRPSTTDARPCSGTPRPSTG